MELAADAMTCACHKAVFLFWALPVHEYLSLWRTVCYFCNHFHTPTQQATEVFWIQSSFLNCVDPYINRRNNTAIKHLYFAQKWTFHFSWGGSCAALRAGSTMVVLQGRVSLQQCGVQRFSPTCTCLPGPKALKCPCSPWPRAPCRLGGYTQLLSPRQCWQRPCCPWHRAWRAARASVVLAQSSRGKWFLNHMGEHSFQSCCCDHAVIESA